VDIDEGTWVAGIKVRGRYLRYIAHLLKSESSTKIEHQLVVPLLAEILALRPFKFKKMICESGKDTLNYQITHVCLRPQRPLGPPFWMGNTNGGNKNKN
jgi:hypothetical protein